MITQALTKMLTDLGWITTIFVGFLTFLLIRHFLKIRKYPPGPFPLPFLGNLLEFNGKKPPFIKMTNWQKKYGPVFTLWVGRPAIIVNNWEVTRDALIVKRNEVIGRNKTLLAEIIKQGYEDIVFADYSQEWEVLRKMAHSAVRKYAVSDKLAELVTDVVNNTAQNMLQEKQPFDPVSHLYVIIYNIIASSAFGKRYKETDQEYQDLKEQSELFLNEFGNGLPSDYIPLLKIFYINREQKLVKSVKKFLAILTNKIDEHKKTYKPDVIRDFTDALLSAKLEAKEEGKNSLQYLSDGNLAQVISDLFAAGTDTTQMTLRWMVLLIANSPDVQQKMFEEIESVIGNRPPVQDDKPQCHYVSAVIMETLRFGTIAPLGIDHKTTCDTEIGGHKIPKDTMVLFNLWAHHRDQTYWKDPHVFKPDRFLTENRTVTNERASSYVPFGQGRRMCLGEKLALADTFLIIVRLLQHCKFSLPGGAGSACLDPQPLALFSIPVPYKIEVTPRK
ncbi:steroid 17-alpha-hydroxylase/17,20 lyase-like isoform X1 [Tachypleus tridentatus]|uniref:steroid 17-alpha-hydroxylase/17,20 lyase-like isoform X1 n=1 Tax=Tachypleus tridentatus TaxID=6853 RepID=UPI003FD2E14A